MTSHQTRQKAIIARIEEQIQRSALSSSMVTPVDDFENDARITLTSVHFPRRDFISNVQQNICKPLSHIHPAGYWYSLDSLHITIKSIRMMNYPPHFTDEDVVKVLKVFSTTVPLHKQFNVYFYRLLLFPTSLSLMGTTNATLDDLILDLDQKLREIGVPDDKTYVNSQYFFANCTIARLTDAAPEAFQKRVAELSDTLRFKPYLVDSVTLLTCNAAFKKRQVYETWKLQ